MSRPVMPPPCDPQTGAPLPPTATPGYYPGHSTMAQKDAWDEATRRKVEARLEPPGALRFFTPQEAETLEAVLECILPQSDRDAAHRIPVLSAIDARLHGKMFDGYIFEGCPEIDVAHRQGAQAVEAMSAEKHGRRFADLEIPEREALLLSIKDGAPFGDPSRWAGLPPKFYWNTLVQTAVSAYYAHPFAWDEIGYGGPAYPRGYMRLREGRPEPWEKDERRYEWQAPPESQSDRTEANENLFPPNYVGKGDPP